MEKEEVGRGCLEQKSIGETARVQSDDSCWLAELQE